MRSPWVIYKTLLCIRIAFYKLSSFHLTADMEIDNSFILSGYNLRSDPLPVTSRLPTIRLLRSDGVSEGLI